MDWTCHLHDVIESLRRDVERLTRERDAAYAASVRDDERHAETVRAVRARAEKAEAERDEAVRARDEWARQCNFASEAQADALNGAATARAQVERLRGALRAVVEEHAHRCFECDAIATWREAVDRGGLDKFWCDKHVWIPQTAISKGALRYQPQRVMFADWFENARIALADAAGEGE